MIAEKLWRALRGQMNKLANALWGADPIAQMQYEYDLAVDQLKDGRAGLEQYRALVERVSRQVSTGQAHVANLEAKIRAYLLTGDRETAAKFALELQKAAKNNAENEAQLAIHETAYNNNLDPWNQGVPRAEISNMGGFNNTYVNNIAYATPAASPADPRCKGAAYNPYPAPCPLMANVGFLGGNGAGVSNVNNTWSNNISFGGAQINLWNSDPQLTGNAWFDADVGKFTCTANQCRTNPQMISPASENFGLQSSSPAISYGITRPDLLAKGADAGSCDHQLAKCP